MKQVFAVDFDNVLRSNKNRIIVKGREMINKIMDFPNALIIIFSARNDTGQQYEFVRDFLNKNKVRYHAIILGKVRADLYIDDKAIKFINGI